MKKLAVVFIAAAITCLTVSCAKADPEVSPTPEQTTKLIPPPVVTTSEPVPPPKPSEQPATDRIPEIKDLTHIETIDVIKGYVLVVAGWYPQTGIETIDKYYADQCEHFASKAGDLAEELRTYDDTGAAATQYSFDDNYEVVKNSGNIFSVHRTIYQYIGGAHGNNNDICDNFRISDGKRLTLDDIFDCTSDEYTEDICKVFDVFIDTHSSGDENYAFFDDAKQMLRDIFPLGSFCITDTGLNFYIPPYFVTPYSSGTVTIPVAWEDLAVPIKSFSAN